MTQDSYPVLIYREETEEGLRLRRKAYSTMCAYLAACRHMKTHGGYLVIRTDWLTEEELAELEIGLE